VIPYYAEDKTLLGFACRAFGKESPKYIQLRIDKNREFIYGADKIDSTKPIIAVEGQIDSMFLENAVAMGTANYNSDYLSQHKDNVIIVPDNDFRRNPHVCSQLKKAINSGFKICLLPDSWKKDINDNVKSGIDRKDIMDYILSNHKQGAEALLEFTLEKRC
jgi:DNA primase